MNDIYIDKWGEERERKDPLDWSGDLIWQYWENEFEWVACPGEFEEQDIVAFKDDVCIENRNGDTTWYNAARFVIARIAGIDNKRAYFEVIHSEGKDAFNPEEKFSRRTDKVDKYGIFRWPRDHGPRDNRTPEQVEKSEFLKSIREELEQWHSSGGVKGSNTPALESHQSQFLASSDDQQSSQFSRSKNKTVSEKLKP